MHARWWWHCRSGIVIRTVPSSHHWQLLSPQQMRRGGCCTATGEHRPNHKAMRLAHCSNTQGVTQSSAHLHLAKAPVPCCRRRRHRRKGFKCLTGYKWRTSRRNIRAEFSFVPQHLKGVGGLKKRPAPSVELQLVAKQATHSCCTHRVVGQCWNHSGVGEYKEAERCGRG